MKPFCEKLLICCVVIGVFVISIIAGCILMLVVLNLLTMKNLILNYWWLILIVIGLLFIFGLIIKGFINASRNPMPENFENGDRIMTELRAKYKDYNDEDIDQTFMNGLV